MEILLRIGGSEAFERNVLRRAESLGTGHPVMQAAWNQCAALYLGEMRNRFQKASRGDGTWQDLAASTKLQRARALKPGTKKGDTGRETTRRKQFDKKVKKAFASGGGTVKRVRKQLIAGMKFAILKDTSLLFNSLTQGAPGSVATEIPFGIRVGTNIKYATHHQKPTIPGRPPKRTIIIQPTERTKVRIRQILEAAVKRAMNDGK